MEKIKVKKKPYDGPELLPPKGDPEVGPKGFELFAAVINDKIDLGLHDKWNRNNELYRNKHWRNKGTGAVPLVSSNLIFVHVQRTSNELTDNDPTFNISRISDKDNPEEQYQQGQFDDLQHSADHWWVDQEQQDILDTSVRSGELNGIAVEKVIFNSELESGLGEVETVNVDPFHFGWYPVKLKDPRKLQQTEAVLHFYPMTIREAKRRWPDKADDIKPDEDVFKELGDERRELSGQDSKKEKSLMLSFSSTVKELLNYLTGSTTLSGDEVLIVEIWCHDYSKSKTVKKVKDESVFEGESSEKEVEEKEPIYPGNIRQVTICNNGKVVLEDRKNPCINWPAIEAGSFPMEEARKTYLFDKFPFSAANSVKDITNAWGLCYDEQTEVLAQGKGFIKFSELTENDFVATRSATKVFEWQKPLRLIKEEYSGEMYQFKSRGVDLLVTPNHKMLVGIQSKTIHEKFMTASDFAEGLNHGRKLPVTSSWNHEEELTNLTFPKGESHNSKDLCMDGDDFFAFMGAYLAEGNVKNYGSVEIAQKRTSKGFAEYYKLFVDRLGGTYNEKTFIVYSTSLRNYCIQFGLCYQKFIPQELKDSSQRQLRILWDFFVLGDGCFRPRLNKSGRGKDNPSTVHITTTSKMLVDGLTEIGQKLGYSVSFSIKKTSEKERESYNMVCRYSDYMGVKATIIPYSGLIYCATVPNHTLYVRRNGKPTWCGNSDLEQLEWLNIELDKAISQMVLYKDKAARLKIINPMDTGVDDDAFDNYPGTIRPSNAQSSAGIRYLEVPAMPVDINIAIQLFKDMFFLVAGTFEMDQAQTPGRNVIAYKAIAALLERAATMKRGKIRSYSRLIRERGRAYISHVQNFYTEDRWITYQENDGLEQSKQINGKNLRVPAKLTVVTGSTLPTSRVQQREEAVGLYKEKAIDQAELLDKIEWPNRNQVIERMKMGPLGEAMGKLNQIGVPKPLTDIFIKAISEDPDKLQKNLETGKFPTFATLFQAMVNDAGGQGAPEQAPDPLQSAEVNLKAAETEKTMAERDKVKAETALTVEKITTEKVTQQVKIAGTTFDEQTLAMERAKTVKDIESSSKQSELDHINTVKDVTKTMHDMDMAKSMQTNRPGFNEKGMKSNNQGE